MGGCNFGNILPINVPKYQRGKVHIFWLKKLSKLSESYYLEPVSTPPLRILLKPSTLSFKKGTNTVKAVSQLNCLEERKKIRFTLQMKDLVFSEEVGHIFGSNVGNEFREIMRGKGPHNPEFAYDICCIHSWFKRTRLSTISLATRKARCSVAFVLFQSSKVETLYLRDSTWTIRFLVTHNSNKYWKILFIVFTMTWKTPAVKNTPCIYRYHSACFDF